MPINNKWPVTWHPKFPVSYYIKWTPRIPILLQNKFNPTRKLDCFKNSKFLYFVLPSNLTITLDIYSFYPVFISLDWTYRITHKRWEFRDDCTELILPLPLNSYSLQMFSFFAKFFNKLLFKTEGLMYPRYICYIFRV